MSRLKLYYSPGACSLAPHIVLEETGADYDVVRVDFSTAEQHSPGYKAINPKGRVPALAEDRWILTENPAILAYLAKRFPEAGLLPADPRREAVCTEWLAWLASTVHVGYAHLRRAERYASSEEAMANVRERGQETCRILWDEIETRLSADRWALGEDYSVVDAYLLVFWHWGNGNALRFAMARDFPRWSAHAHRMAGHQAVQRVFEAEALVLPA